MKKKGLIISTIVMVVVLIASLTTATYAWFNNSGSATVTPIQFSVGTNADILIGVEVDNQYDSTANASNFYADSTEWNSSTSKWSGSTNGLGLSIDTGVDLRNMQKAVYSFTDVSGLGTDDAAATQDAYTRTAVTPLANNVVASAGEQITAGINTTNTLLKGAGNGTTVNKPSLENAVNLQDYLQVAFGAAAAKTDVLAFGCMVYVQPTDTKATLGLNASIHVAYKLNDAASWTEIDVYGQNGYGKAKSTGGSPMVAPSLPSVTIGSTTKPLSGSTITPAAGDAYVWIPMYSAASASAYATQDQIQQIQLLIYICGPDSDCITSATGVTANISIEFLSLNKSQYEAA